MPTGDGNSCVLREAAQIIPTAALSPVQHKLLAALRSSTTASGATGPEWKTMVPDVLERTYYHARKQLVDLGYVVERGQRFVSTGKQPPEEAV